MTGQPEVLPDSRARETKGIVYRLGVPWIPIFCASCGKPGGMVPEDSGHAFYLCDSPCAEKWGGMAGTMAVPDEVFWARVADELGRAPTTQDAGLIDKLAKER